MSKKDTPDYVQNEKGLFSFPERLAIVAIDEWKGAIKEMKKSPPDTLTAHEQKIILKIDEEIKKLPTERIGAYTMVEGGATTLFDVLAGINAPQPPKKTTHFPGTPYACVHVARSFSSNLPLGNLSDRYSAGLYEPDQTKWFTPASLLIVKHLDLFKSFARKYNVTLQNANLTHLVKFKTNIDQGSWLIKTHDPLQNLDENLCYAIYLNRDEMFHSGRTSPAGTIQGAALYPSVEAAQRSAKAKGFKNFTIVSAEIQVKAIMETSPGHRPSEKIQELAAHIDRRAMVHELKAAKEPSASARKKKL